jgi:hypothetical protein
MALCQAEKFFQAAGSGGFDPFQQIAFCARAHFGRGYRAILEHHQRWNRANAKLRRNILILIDIDFDDLDLIGQFSGDLFQSRGNHLAWPAPGRPEIDNDRDRAFKNFF